VAKPAAIAPKTQPVVVDEPIALKKVAGSDMEWQEF
jgi:hypothetical protein